MVLWINDSTSTCKVKLEWRERARYIQVTESFLHLGDSLIQSYFGGPELINTFGGLTDALKVNVTCPTLGEALRPQIPIPIPSPNPQVFSPQCCPAQLLYTTVNWQRRSAPPTGCLLMKCQIITFSTMLPGTKEWTVREKHITSVKSLDTLSHYAFFCK